MSSNQTSKFTLLHNIHRPAAKKASQLFNAMMILPDTVWTCRAPDVTLSQSWAEAVDPTSQGNLLVKGQHKVKCYFADKIDKELPDGTPGMFQVLFNHTMAHRTCRNIAALVPTLARSARPDIEFFSKIGAICQDDRRMGTNQAQLYLEAELGPLFRLLFMLHRQSVEHQTANFQAEASKNDIHTTAPASARRSSAPSTSTTSKTSAPQSSQKRKKPTAEEGEVSAPEEQDARRPAKMPRIDKARDRRASTRRQPLQPPSTNVPRRQPLQPVDTNVPRPEHRRRA